MCGGCSQIERWGVPPHYLRPDLKVRPPYVCWTYVWVAREYNKEFFLRFHRNELRRIPKRDPDDPGYCLGLGEGLLPFMFRSRADMKDWYFLIYRPTRRRRLYRLKASGEGATLPKRVARGVEDETNGWPTLYEF